MKDIKHVWPYFVSEDIVWFSNYFAGGLYTYDYKKEVICCKIKSDILFSYGIFEIMALTCWKSLVFIFSDKFNGSHIVYDSLKNKVKRIEGLKDKQYDVIHQTIVIDDILYLIPSEIRQYIYIVKLSALHETNDSVNLIVRKMELGITIRTWLPKKYNHSLYIPEYGGKRVLLIVNGKVKVIDLEIPSGLYAIDVLEKELWIAPIYGKYIFCSTLDGKIVDRIEIPWEYGSERKNDIWEIVAKDKFVLFVHWKKPEIDIYIKKNKKIIQIDGNEGAKSNEQHYEQHYLPYIINNDVVRFLPSGCCMLEIDLLNLTYHQKELGFPINILDREWEKWCKIVTLKRCIGRCLDEKNAKECKIFKEYILAEKFLYEYIKSRKDRVGRLIYQCVFEKI